MRSEQPSSEDQKQKAAEHSQKKTKKIYKREQTCSSRKESRGVVNT